MEKFSIFELIRNEVRKIPRGSVLTYGDIAKKLGMRDSRKVGWAIYGNMDSSIPCHRVVRKDGGLAEKFSLGGILEHRSRLEQDGIVFTDLNKVDLTKYLWNDYFLC